VLLVWQCAHENLSSTKRYWSDSLRVTEVMDVKVSAYTSTASVAAANVTRKYSLFTPRGRAGFETTYKLGEGFRRTP
jgi:hypothetical protein